MCDENVKGIDNYGLLRLVRSDVSALDHDTGTSHTDERVVFSLISLARMEHVTAHG